MKGNREYLIEIDDLHFAYGANQVLRGVKLRVPRGKVVAILGVSGSGKSHPPEADRRPAAAPARTVKVMAGSSTNWTTTRSTTCGAKWA